MEPTSGRQRVYYHHLKKCGGTTLNVWLDSQFPNYPDNFREIQIAAFGQFDNEENRFLAERQKMRAFAENIYAERDLLHDHAALVRFVPAGTFRFTVLRDPASRILSNIRDYRRLAKQRWPQYSDAVHAMLRDTVDLSVGDFLETYARHNAPHGQFFDNYLVRILAHNRVGALANSEPNAERLVPAALEVLREDFDFVGLLEEAGETNRLLASYLGWCPVERLVHRNETQKSESAEDIVEAAAGPLERATRYDWIVYREGRKLFEKARARVYDRDVFEALHLAQRLSLLAPAKETKASGAFYDWNRPVIGSGHSGREILRDRAIRIKTVSGDPFILYIPTPPNREMELYLQLERGSLPAEKDIQQHFLVDDRPVTASVSRLKKQVSVAIRSQGNGWTRLEYTAVGGEDMKPTLSIIGYGWRP